MSASYSSPMLRPKELTVLSNIIGAIDPFWWACVALARMALSRNSRPPRVDILYSSLIAVIMLSNPQFRKGLSTCLSALLAITIPFMLWEALTIITGATQPIIVVISQSMAPAFNRGDLLFLWNRQSWIHVGEIPVCWFSGRPLPMVHRAIRTVTLDAMR